MDRRNCTHGQGEPCVVIITFCTRCQAWRYSRLGVPAGLNWVDGSLELFETHHLPLEEASPDELQMLIQRAFRAAQEWAQDLIDWEHSYPG